MTCISSSVLDRHHPQAPGIKTINLNTVELYYLLTSDHNTKLEILCWPFSSRIKPNSKTTWISKRVLTLDVLTVRSMKPIQLTCNQYYILSLCLSNIISNFSLFRIISLCWLCVEYSSLNWSCFQIPEHSQYVATLFRPLDRTHPTTCKQNYELSQNLYKTKLWNYRFILFYKFPLWIPELRNSYYGFGFHINHYSFARR